MSAPTPAVAFGDTDIGREPWRPLSFALPESLEAHEPPEARGLARDDVRLMVSSPSDDTIVHTGFNRLPDFLRAGDVLVVNTSATINAALRAVRPGGEPVELHLSQWLPGGHWVVELRRIEARGTAPLLTGVSGERLALPAAGLVTLVAPYRPRPPRHSRHSRHSRHLALGASVPSHSTGWTTGPSDGRTRLWLASVEVEGDLLRYLDHHGFPIRYAYVPEAWPLRYYQTVFAEEPGSAEMPSAGRAFTPRIVDELRRKGVVIAPILLHAGVASLEDHEPPYPEFYRVSAAAAGAVNDARRRARRIVAVGTTTVRALETATGPDGRTVPSEGWTDLVITPERGLRAVDALLTGLHEPRASHLAMLEALAGRRHLEVAYAAALRERYLWHEFGDLHLILPDASPISRVKGPADRRGLSRG
jgi:S-adenosylmethionine:tRNA ribosyltransferase-isomerase